MLISTSKDLVFIEVTKTGSTAIQAAMAPYCEIELGTKGFKHLTYSDYERYFLPLMVRRKDRPVETFCIVRDPFDWVQSWYKFRSRPALLGDKNSCAHVSYTEFVEAMISEAPPPFANMKRQYEYVSGADGKIGVDHIFRYGDSAGIEDFLSHKMGRRIKFKRRNVSPQKKLERLPQPLFEKLRENIAEDLALFAQRALPVADYVSKHAIPDSHGWQGFWKYSISGRFK